MRRQTKELHPNAIRSQTQLAEEKYFALERQYNNGSPAMKRYLEKKVISARKTYLKWKAKSI